MINLQIVETEMNKRLLGMHCLQSLIVIVAYFCYHGRCTDGHGVREVLENLIGKGGHAEVYKGRLADGQFIAVKRLTKGGNKEDRVSDFLCELEIIAHVNKASETRTICFKKKGKQKRMVNGLLKTAQGPPGVSLLH